MLTLNELESYLTELLPSNRMVDYAINGLQIEGKSEIYSIATAVSASLATIEEACRLEVDALIVHHGIFWSKDTLAITGVKQKKIKRLLEKNLSLFAYHLPLDAHPLMGNNWKAARDLGWHTLSSFGEIGVKGQTQALSRECLKAQLEQYYGHMATCAFGGKRAIEKIALVSGGAYKLVEQAAKEGVDAFVTGSFDEPAWHAAFEEGINFYALGHSATERVGPQALAVHLQEVFHLPCSFIDIENPF